MRHWWSSGVGLSGLTLAACGTGPAGEGDIAKIREPAVLINANFDSGTNGFSYLDDTFGTSVPSGASGTNTNGRLRVSLGQVFGQGAQSGGWRNTFSAPGVVTGSFFYQIASTGFFEAGECTQVRMTIDGTTYGSGTNPYVAQVCGPNGATSGTFNFTTASLPSGSHTITIGG